MSKLTFQNAEPKRKRPKNNSAQPLRKTLLEACEDGDYAMVVMNLIRNPDSINYAHNGGVNPLWVAIAHGHAIIVNELLAAGANVNTAGANGVKSLMVACRRGHLEIVQMLLAAGANVNAAGANGVTSLLVACRRGHLEIVQMLLAAGANVNTAEADGITPLWIACLMGHLEIVQMLLAAGANVNTAIVIINERVVGGTPLIVGIAKGHATIVNELLAAGANVNTAFADGVTPLMVACRKGHLEIVQMLLADGANVNTAEANGFTPLWVACFRGHLEIVNELLAAGANVNRTNSRGKSPLWIACRHAHLAIVNALLDKGATLMIPHFIHPAVAHLLLSKRDNVGISSKVTPLTLALYMPPSHDLPALYADAEQVKRLLSRPRIRTKFPASYMSFLKFPEETFMLNEKNIQDQGDRIMCPLRLWRLDTNQCKHIFEANFIKRWFFPPNGQARLKCPLCGPQSDDITEVELLSKQKVDEMNASEEIRKNALSRQEIARRKIKEMNESLPTLRSERLRSKASRDLEKAKRELEAAIHEENVNVLTARKLFRHLRLEF